MPQHVFLIGASRGIGLELARQYRAEGARVTATARDDDGLARLRALGAAALKLDVADPVSASGLAWQIDGAGFDRVIHNAGVIGPRTQGLQPPGVADFDAVMHANVLGPMQVLPQLADALAPGARLVLISSRMGSMGLRSSTASWLYRASKAAVNSVLKDVSIAFEGRALCVALHPGWVRTDMGGAGADLAVDDAVRQIRATIEALRPAQHGSFVNHDGQPLAW